MLVPNIYPTLNPAMKTQPHKEGRWAKATEFGLLHAPKLTWHEKLELGDRTWTTELVDDGGQVPLFQAVLLRVQILLTLAHQPKVLCKGMQSRHGPQSSTDVTLFVRNRKTTKCLKSPLSCDVVIREYYSKYSMYREKQWTQSLNMQVTDRRMTRCKTE